MEAPISPDGPSKTAMPWIDCYCRDEPLEALRGLSPISVAQPSGKRAGGLSAGEPRRR